MQRFFHHLVIAGSILTAGITGSFDRAAQAQEYYDGAAIGSPASSSSPASYSASSSSLAGAPTTTVPLVGLGVGAFDFEDDADRDPSTDIRFEYLFGNPLFYVFKPMIGLEGTTDSAAAVFGGIVADWIVRDHWVIAPSFAAGLWLSGSGKDMGSPIEFRSQLEMGYRFENDWRLTAQVSHISNADIGDKNPGSEVIGLYVRAPVDSLFPR